MIDPILLRRQQRVSGAVLAGWGVALAWLVHALTTTWPNAGHPAQFALLLVMPGVLFRAADLLFIRWRGRLLRGWRRWAVRVGFLPLGAVLGASMWQATDALAMSRFETRMSPLLAQIESRLAAPCPPDARYEAMPAIADFMNAAGAPTAKALLHHDKDRFLLALPGRALDIDGCTIVYDSATRQWDKFHNDRQTRSAAYDALADKLPACEIPLR